MPHRNQSDTHPGPLTLLTETDRTLLDTEPLQVSGDFFLLLSAEERKERMGCEKPQGLSTAGL